MATDSAWDAKKLYKDLAKENLALFASINVRRDKTKKKIRPSGRWRVEQVFGIQQWNRGIKFCWAKAKDSFNDPQELLHAVEAVYADFGYPEDMSQFIYYMPCEYSAASSAQSPDEARLLLFEALKDFLAQEKLFLLSHVEKLK